ncbi:MAG: SDR family oxidoreductase [Planctomycetaceae bacterium]|nr:SDR family oxidoreductase [Planctomycetaceae bacterium]
MLEMRDQSTQEFVFLTGATGLLGSYILHNLLKRKQNVALLARPGRKETAEQRISKILAHWKRGKGDTLPTPKVFSGDLTQLDYKQPGELQELYGKCKSIIHCAASLTFYGPQGEEPWTSNVDGTKRILDFCEAAEVPEMHYVSTAYVAGSSKHFYEQDLDAGQELRNDYEKSKFEAEKIVRSADFLDQLTVYRPSIVVGDAATGFTTTFHGFYAVLKLAHTLVSRLPMGSTSGRNLLTALGMDGSERKNFVPVDWVTNVFDHIFSNPKYHGRTYHLTTPKPPLLTDFVDMVQDAVETWSTLADERDPLRADEEWFFKHYASEVQIYKAYLQDDPQFDSANTQWAAPHLPCPVMDRELMLFLARYAILSRFGKRKVPKDLIAVPAKAKPVGVERIASPVHH